MSLVYYKSQKATHLTISAKRRYIK